MSWMKSLSETYDRCSDYIGVMDNGIPLLPIGHTLHMAQIEITLDDRGAFLSARVLDRDESMTIAPCTQESDRRTSGPVSHPLSDRLQYVASDFSTYGAEESHFSAFVSLLGAWSDFDPDNWKIQAVRHYSENSALIRDLIDWGIFELEETDDKKSPRVIWTEGSRKSARGLGSALRCFVRWSVERAGYANPSMHTDPEIWNSWIGYNFSIITERGLCQVTGEVMALAHRKSHPSGIRHLGDRTKLISSSDDSGFTFRGRFDSASEACTVGYEITHKAHNCLRWLIDKQGYRSKNREQVILAWAAMGIETINPADDLFTQFFGDDVDWGIDGYTGEEAARMVNKLLEGRVSKYPLDDITIMGLDSATKGRMAIKYYKEISSSDFLERIMTWYNSCSWELQNPKNKKKFVERAPSPQEIADSIYGVHGDKLSQSVIERILPCIIDGWQIPMDILTAAVHRASQPLAGKNWMDSLRIACALYRKRNEEEGYEVALDEDRSSRDYLYGRLLALANRLEERAQYEAGEKRQTNALRMMHRFSQRPYSTWPIIEHSLLPYKARLGSKSDFIDRIILDVMDKFTVEEFMDDTPLSGEYLLGFYSQRKALFQKKEKKPDEEE